MPMIYIVFKAQTSNIDFLINADMFFSFLKITFLDRIARR